MNKHELNLLQTYVKKRFDEVDMDYKLYDTFGETDMTLTYAENRRITDEKLNFLPKVVPKLKRETTMSKQQQEFRTELKKESEKIELQVKLIFEKELEKIINTKTSENLDKIYLIPREYLKMVLEKKSRGLLLYGEAGLGKTHNVKRALAEHKLKESEDFCFICGHITPLQFYKKLYYNKDKLIVLDDVNILESKINLNMLKACLETGLIEYHSTTAKLNIPSEFVFSGQIILLLNEKPLNSEHLKAVESRILHHNLEMSYHQKIATLFEIAKDDNSGMEIPLNERIKITKWIKSHTNESTKNLNIRLLFTCYAFYKHNKELWEILAENIIQNDEYVMMLIQGLETEWCEATGKHRATFYRNRKSIMRQCDMNATINATKGTATITK